MAADLSQMESMFDFGGISLPEEAPLEFTDDNFLVDFTTATMDEQFTANVPCATHPGEQ
jgi:hypothetical protein